VSSLPDRIEDVPPPYGTVVFDCDSTLSAIEGIDELGAITGVGRDAVAALTERAMAGEIPLEQVYGARLDLLRPDRQAVEELGRRYVAAALPHARELIDALAALGKRIRVVSGGIDQAVRALTDHLGLPSEGLLAVEVFHGRSGAYQGWDELSPLARSGGKLEVLREISSSEHGGGVALVGDGVTDLEAAPAVRRFVAFAGVARRQAVLSRARVRCERADLAALLPFLVSEDEAEELAGVHGMAALVRAAFAAR
jgi:phosphoserine phosphatase